MDDGGAIAPARPDTEPAQQAPHRRRRRAIGWGIALLAVAAIVAGLFAIRAANATHLTLPAQIDGATALSNSRYDQAREAFNADMAKRGLHGVIGWYGTDQAALPTFAVGAFDARLDQHSDLLYEVEPSLASSIQLDTSKESNWAVGSVSYECAPVAASGGAGSVLPAQLCVWVEPKSAGYVAVFDPSQDTRSLVPSVHDAVVS